MLVLAGLPLVVRRLPLSLPIVLVTTGAGLALLPNQGEPPDPREHLEAVERLTEFVVLVSLMGAGLKLDTPVGLRRWATTWRLLGITMPLSIAGIALLSWLVLDLSWPPPCSWARRSPPPTRCSRPTSRSAPRQGRRRPRPLRPDLRGGAQRQPRVPVRESGAGAGRDPVVLVRALDAGVAGGRRGLEDRGRYRGGWLVGRLAAFLLFRMPEQVKLARAGDGFVAIGVTLLAYGLTELAHGYGFLAVFCAAVTIRNGERGHEIHHRLHDFADEVERIATAALLVMFGASLVSGLLAPLTARWCWWRCWRSWRCARWRAWPA
jgi:NhaP-type Na+/H+ or K+/H+ antiporter